jgi:hypothetical protein
MYRLNVWVLLSAAILSLVITGRPASAQQGQNSFPSAFRVIGNDNDATTMGPRLGRRSWATSPGDRRRYPWHP